MRWNLRVVLICISLMIKDVEHFFRCFSAIRYSSGENSLFSSEPHFLMGIFDFLESTFLSSLYILDIIPLSDLGQVKILSQSVGGLFCLIDSVFCLAEALQSHEVPFVNSRSYSTSHCCSIQELFPCAHILEAFPPFSPISLSVSGFMWSSLIHLDLTLVQGDRNGSIAFFYMITTSCASTICWKCCLFIHWIILAPLSKIKWP